MKAPRWLRRLGISLLIGGQATAAIARGRISPNDLLQELLEAGPGSFLIVLITGLAAGTAFNIQVAAELSKQGASAAIGGLLALGLSREIAPLLTATLLTGKVATAYAAQLGTMKVTEQIDAITMLRSDPVEYLVVPRLLAMVVMSPVQCLLFFGVAIWSGQLSCTLLYNVPPAVFWNSVHTWMEANDLPSMLLKAVVFGLRIAVIACGWGLTTRGGPKEVGSPQTIADALERWMTETDIDGFNLVYSITPGDTQDFVDLVVPELQRRGIYKTEYSPGTLREKLFCSGSPHLRPDHPGARFRAQPAAV